MNTYPYPEVGSIRRIRPLSRCGGRVLGRF
jgi:hypothetical protein